MYPLEYAEHELAELRRRGYIATAGTALDVGCGKGEFLVALRNMGWTAIGIDPQIERRGEEGLYSARFLEENMPSDVVKAYDLVSFRESFYYMDGTDKPPFWELVRRLLKPRGLLYIKSHVRSSYWHLIHMTQTRERRLGNATLLPNADQLLEMLSNEGFQIEVGEPYPWNDLPTNPLARKFVEKLGLADRYWFLAKLRGVTELRGLVDALS